MRFNRPEGEMTLARFGLGIDIGGTFTDIVLYDGAASTQFSHKQLTTPNDPTEGVMAGITHLLDQTGIAASDITRVVHATTLFTNSLIERRGATVGLITTDGFRDALEIGRERKYELYDLHIQKPEPLVPRAFRSEVAERIDASGQVVIPLDEAGLVATARGLVENGAQSLAVVFLHSYANPMHERRALDILADAFPAIPLSGSIDVAPEIREYERTSTTTCNAYIKPLAELYLETLSQKLHKAGVAAQLLMMLSNGGLTNVDEAKRVPVQLLESGPAAGALAAAFLAADDGGAHVLAFDMGGTTAKLSVIDHGAPKIAYSFEAARAKRFIEGSGLPLKISTLELIEIGAGGGSIAHIDDIGLLKVGPHSAGSEPGPACYGRGGTAPTVTDANLLLGYLDPDFFAGGTIAVSPDLARRALAPLGEASSLEVARLAWGIYEVVNENMANAARVHIAEHGKDPRDYSLLATGGGGPLHGYYVAKKLGLKRLIVPPSAGVASALGLLIAPARVDRVATVAQEISTLDWARLESLYAAMTEDALTILDDTGLDRNKAVVRRAADIRYRGQAFELVVRLPDGPYSAASEQTLLDAFQASYIEAFTRTPPATDIEVINARVSITLELSDRWHGVARAGRSYSRPEKTTRPAYFPEQNGFATATVYDRMALGAGAQISGPAIIEEPESTLIVGPAGSFTVSRNGNIIVDIE
jgi:N-methylhydantoinase A